MPFVKREYEYYKYDTEPNASIVGSFGRITDGIASGFSATNCLQVPETIEVGSNTWERVIKISTGSDVNTEQTIWGASPDHQGLLLRIVDGRKLRLWLSTNGTSWDLANLVTSSLSISAYTTYYIKISFDGSQYLVDVSTDGISYTNYITFTSSTPIVYQRICIGCHNYTGSAFDTPFYGSIDISKSYIKVGDDTVWDGTNYTKFGSWIDGGVVSGFTTGNYLTLPEVFNPQSNPWEALFKVKINTLTNGAQIILGQRNGGGYNFYVDINKVRLEVGGTTFTGTTTLQENTTYWFNYTFTGDTYIVKSSTNGADWVDEINEASIVTATPTSDDCRIGVWYNTYNNGLYNPFLGSINLNESYIKINNKLWWHGTKYYKVNLDGDDIYEDWKQPVLSSNGIIGGDTFAVTASTQRYPAYGAFEPDGRWSSDTYATGPQWLTFYNPNALVIKKITLNYGNGESYYYVRGIYIQGSNDNSSWVNLYNYTSTSYSDKIVCEVNSETAYRYHRIYIYDRSYYNTEWCVAMLGVAEIVAQELKQIGSDTYDYSIPRNKLYQLAKKKRHYYKYDYRDYTLKNMTGYSSPEGSVSQTISDDYYTSARYQLFWNRGMQFNTKYPTGTVYVIYQFPYPLKPDTYRITMSGVSQNNTNVTARIYIQYTDGEELYLQEKLIYTSTVNWDFEHVATKPIKRIGFHGVANPWNSANTVCTLSGFNIMSTTGSLQTYHGFYEINATDKDVWIDWKQPVLSSNSSYSALKVSATNEGQGEAWKAFNNDTGNGWCTANNVTTGTLTATVDKDIFVSSIKVTGLKNQYGSTNTITIYSDTNKQNIIGEQKSFDYSVSDTLVWNFEKPVKANTLAFYGTGTTWVNIAEIKITAKELMPTGSIEDADYYIDGFETYTPVLKNAKHYVTLFESETAGTYSVDIPEDSIARVTLVGGGGAAAIRGVYDDRGYGWSGGSAGAYRGIFALPKGTYNVTVASANNNTSGQGGNTATLNPSDTSTHDSYISGVIRVGGGGAGTTSGVGAAGAAATFEITPMETLLNSAGKAGAYGSGGKGSGANATMQGGASVYKNYGAGQGCSTSEYAARRYWIDGTGGFVKIEIMSTTEQRLF